MVEIETSLAPQELLQRIKFVEKELGRDLEGAERNGPRVLWTWMLSCMEQKMMEAGEAWCLTQTT